MSHVIEPLHFTRQDAISWVKNNTDNYCYAAKDAVIRVDPESGSVLVLESSEEATFYWSKAHRLYD